MVSIGVEIDSGQNLVKARFLGSDGLLFWDTKYRDAKCEMRRK